MVALGLVQGVVVVLALVLGGVDMASPVGVALISLLAAVSFSLVAYAMRLGGGATGIAIFVLLLLVQIAALSNVVPLETAPALLQRLNGLLPLTAFADAASRLISGGEVGSLVGPVVVLVAWGLGGLHQHDDHRQAQADGRGGRGTRSGRPGRRRRPGAQLSASTSDSWRYPTHS